jgi:radical SAM-linked protein
MRGQGHTFDVWSAAFRDSLPWLAARLGLVPPSPAQTSLCARPPDDLQNVRGAPPRLPGMARVRPGEAANPAPPTVQRVRLRFAKRGRLRFLSHRDVARSFERAVRRAGVPVAHSHGFSPHPRLSWIGAAPTGTASEAEYMEIGLTRPVDPAALAAALDAALPDGLDVLAAAVAEGAPLAERIEASSWLVELPGVEPAALQAALSALLERESVVVERVTPSGRRKIDVRAALVRADVRDPARDGTAPSGGASAIPPDRAEVCAILTAVVRQTTPAVRPDDVLGALDVVAGLRPPSPARATRMAQGLLDHRGDLADPLG